MESSLDIAFTHHGAVDGVTGSCHQLSLADGRSLLVTHLHIDHVGRIPYLLAAGFDGPIVCSEASAALLPMVLEDALKVGFTRDAKLIERALAEELRRRHAGMEVVVPA